MRAQAKARTLKLMGFDVDGVLTDGTLCYTAQGDEIKSFNVRDGHGIKMLAQAGILVAIITARRSRAVALRAENLGVSLLLQGVEDKREAMSLILEKHGLTFAQAGYMGDDVVDLPLLGACGFSATVRDGHDEVRRSVDYVCRNLGGKGAVREVCEIILTAQDEPDKAAASGGPPG